MKKSKTKFPITHRFSSLKKMYNSKDFDVESFDLLSSELVSILGECTMRQLVEIEGHTIDTWKNRVWNLIENAGLLPEYKGEDEEKFVEVIDNWYTEEE